MVSLAAYITFVVYSYASDDCLLVFFGTYFGGLTLAGGLLLGAILAPTDPLLASEVQVGPPLEGGEHPIRYTLTTEAGLNDGFGFPFVYLALAIAGTAMITPAFITNWVFVDILYRTVAGFGIGAGIGIALSKVLFDYPHQNPLAQTRCGVVAIGGVLLCYGITELCKGYGFIAVFTAGVVLRHSESKHKFHRTLHGVTDPIEQVMTAFILFALGVVMPLLMDSLDWFHASIALFLIFFLRPVFGWLSLYGTSMEKHNRAVVSFYGVRGIGSIYYIAFASTHLELTNNGELWSIVGFTILVSAIVHGLTAGLVIERATEQS